MYLISSMIHYIDIIYYNILDRKEENVMRLTLADKNDIIESALVIRQWMNTQDPFVVVRAMGIEPLSIDVEAYVIRGYSNYHNDNNIELRINPNLSEKEQIAVCAHELGHIVFQHTGKNYYKDNNLDREYCANLFAVAFLYLYNRYRIDDIINLTNFSLQTILDLG